MPFVGILICLSKSVSITLKLKCREAELLGHFKQVGSHIRPIKGERGLSDKKVSSPSKGVILILPPSWQNGAIRPSYKKALFLFQSLLSPDQNKNKMPK